ncbi:MAG TPA: hypothetical protein VFO85_05480, partial [Vicinamibacteria bacterium]|nr:hypothetical protein [Vicinamibacteria bacterium]
MTSGRWKRAAGPAALVAVMSAVAGFWAWFHWAPPGTAFLTVNPDPEVPYLLTSLAVFKGQPYAFVQHPGAPLALVGTALLAPLRPFGGARDFVLSVLGRPGVFMLAVHALLLAATLLCMWRMARQAPPGGAQRVVLAAAFFSFLPGAFFWPAFWTHDAVAFPLGTLLLAAAWESVKRGRPPSARRALLLGAGAGTMTASGLSFAVWAVGLVLLPVVLAACARRRPLQALARALLVAGGAVLAFALWTLPLLGAAKL